MKIKNPDFNWDAARKSYDAMMKLDKDEAELLSKMIVFDVVNEDIRRNYTVLQKHLEDVVDSQLTDIRKAIVQRYRREGASAELESLAKAVDEISKADWDPVMHPRNRKGQFTFTVKTTPGFKALSAKEARRTGIPSKDKLSPEEKARYHQEYQQVSNLLETARHAGFDDPKLIIENAVTGAVNVIPNPGTKPRHDAWDPKVERVVGVRMQPEQLGVHGASFDLMTSLGGGAYAADALGAGIAGAAGELGSFSTKWNDYGADTASNAQMYNRVSASAGLLGAVAPYSNKAQVAAKFGQVVGEHGAEAEKVFGPPTRKAMYRYRGTERQIDSDLKIKANRESYKARDGGPAAQATARKMVYARYLAGRLPKKELNQLQLESGVTPPSEGFIINANGEVAVQAVGYGDDHYLPFNLKNMAKHMKGGEYIRTRSVGGPTSEDVYAGWMTGAKQLTVISRSGVFEIEYERDFRGGRRYNQKASRMIGRYERLVDSLAFGNVERESVPIAERRRLVEQVHRDSKGLLSPKEVNEHVNHLIRERSASRDLTPKEWEEFEEQFARFSAAEYPEGISAGEEDHLRNEQYEQFMARRAKTWELNAQGYKGAMDALKEQFPYYIKDVRYLPNLPKEQSTDELRPIQQASENAPDTGLVEHTRNRPTRARGTFHSYTAGGGVKRSAAEMDYQAGGREARVEPPKPKPPEAKPKDPDKLPEKPPEEVPLEVKEDYAQKALSVRKTVLPLLEGDPSWMAVDLWNPAKMDDAAFVAAMKTTEGKKRFEKEVGKYSSHFINQAGFSEAYDQMNRVGGQFGQAEYDKTLHLLTAGENPYSFPDFDEEALMGRFSNTPTFTGKAVIEMDDADIVKELNASFSNREKVSTILSVAKDLPTAQRVIQQVSQAKSVFGADMHPIIAVTIHDGNTEKLDEYIEGLHKARKVKQRQGSVVPPKAPGEEMNKSMTSSPSLLDELENGLLKLELLLLE